MLPTALPTAFQMIVNEASLHMFIMAFTGPGKGKVESIEPNELYAPATLAALLGGGRDDRLKWRVKLRRVTFKKFPQENGKPKPDGRIEKNLPTPLDAWFGWRWIEQLQ